jgi:hypothetical protein
MGGAVVLEELLATSATPSVHDLRISKSGFSRGDFEDGIMQGIF